MNNSRYTGIVVTGADAFEFLQGQLSVDLNELRSDSELLSAWCNPKGRVICLMTVQAVSDGYRLILPAELAESVVERLKIFRFRAKVEFAIEVGAERHLQMEGSLDDWLLGRLKAGIVEIGSEQSEKFTPHMLNLDRIGAVSLDKGCYTGQEVVARTHYRGASKRRCFRYRAASPIQSGDKVTDGNRKIGEVVNAIGTDLLAVVPVAQSDATLYVNDVALTIVQLDANPEKAGD
ncbi:MAG: hypothetical protein KJO82_14845 [Gammaproteobacteria bacterium]|nr:hypothetical protein [Gammaproteobacteria bacterium]